MARPPVVRVIAVLCSLVSVLGCSGGGGGGGTADVPALQPPGNVQASAGDGSITVSWDAVSGADGYVVYVARQSGLTKASYASLPGGVRLTGRTSPARIDSLVNGTPYWLLVTAVRSNPAAESAESSVVSATPVAPSRPGDTSPATGMATAVTGTSATLHGLFTAPAAYQTSAWFEYGPTTAYGSTTAPDDYLTTGSVDYAKGISGLTPLSTIHYRLVTRNSGGTFAGADATLTTLGQPVVLLSDLDQPTEAVSDTTALYWLEVYAGRLRRHDLSTGVTTTIATPALPGNSASLALDANWLYFAASGGGLSRVAHDGSGLVANFSPSFESVSDVVAHTTGLYLREHWTEQVNQSGQPAFVGHDYVTKVSLDGSTSTRLFERSGGDSSGFGGGLAVDATSVYFSDYFLGSVTKVPISGGPAVTLAQGLGRPGQLILEGHDLYVAGGPGIVRIDVTTGQSTVVYTAPGGSDELRMAKDGGAIFASGVGGLGRIDVATGTMTLLALQPERVGTPLVTPSAIYWLVPGSRYEASYGRLERLPRP